MCNCTNEVNEQLAEMGANTRLAFAFQITKDMGLIDRLLVGVEKVDKAKRKPPMNVFASFCPFCGTKLEPEVQ